MRIVTFVLIVALFLGGVGYWYHTVLAVCDVPVTYRIGSVDERFSIKDDEVRNAISTAESLWEDGTDRNLFTYDPQGEVVIHFVYDDRQAAVDSAKRFETTLEKKETVSDSVRAEYDVLVEKYEELKKSYESRVDIYEDKLREYNKEVSEWNGRGGAPKDVFARLEITKDELAREERQLNPLAKELNTLVAKINALSARGNALVDDYNELVETYNDTFADGREFTQGEYHDGVITIFEFESEDELAIVLAHELGHAIGLGHTHDGDTSIMYPVMGKQSLSVGVTSFDRTLFQASCGAVEDSWAQTLLRIQKTLLGMLKDLGG